MHSHKNGNTLNERAQRITTARHWQYVLGSVDGVYYMSVDNILDAMDSGNTLEELKAFYWVDYSCEASQAY
jgi:hypothetical protein